MKVLLTGGPGYIGSHTALELLAAGYAPVLLDNFANSSAKALAALGALAGRDLPFVAGDVRDGRRSIVCSTGTASERPALRRCEGSPGVGARTAVLLREQRAGTAVLLDRMAAHGVKTLVFSSSAAGLLRRRDAALRGCADGSGHALRAHQAHGRDHAARSARRGPAMAHLVSCAISTRGRSPGRGPRRRPLGRRHEPAATHRRGGARPRACLRSTAAITRPRTVPACATTSMSSTSPGRTSWRSSGWPARRDCRRTPGRRPGHSVLEVVAAFERASGLAVPVRMVGRRSGRWPSPAPMRPARRRSWGGALATISTVSAKTCGGRSRRGIDQ